MSQTHDIFICQLVLFLSGALCAAATSFTDAQLGRVINALNAAGPAISQNTISLLWSDQ